jgi:glycogen debranching enzyme
MADAKTVSDQQLHQERSRASGPGRVLHERDALTSLPAYHLPMSGLGLGSSLGNGHCWVTLRGNGNVNGVFSTDIGKNICGSILFVFSGLGSRLVFDGEHRQPHGPDAWVRLRPEQEGEVTLHPAYQRCAFQLPGELDVTQTTFVPKQPPRRGSHEPAGEPPVVYTLIRITNSANEQRRLRVFGFASIHGDTDPDIAATHDETRHALIARNQGTSDWVRVFGASEPLAAYGTTQDPSKCYSVSHVTPQDNNLDATGNDVLAVLQIEVDLRPNESKEIAFTFAFSHKGEEQAKVHFDKAHDVGAVREMLHQTIAFYREAVEPAEVLTPDAVINEGAIWAKIAMLKVMADYPTGLAFTNDPSNSSAVVGRDSFWFVYGCDHLRDEYSCSLLRNFANRQHPDGLILEFYNAVTGETSIDGMNINDNTPLFILAVNHHWRSAGHRECVEEFYPAVVKAARCILSQRNEQGLVWCTATGTAERGIIGWRNIIPNYRISGAVTEVNAECAAALRAARHLAENLGRTDDAEEFRQGAEDLINAINTYLLDPNNGLYYLNIDVDGRPRANVTSDEVFPVIFRVAPEDVAFRIVSRLNVSDFWTEAGLRTVSADSPEFDPNGQWGLLGGVWPGVTWWYAFAAARYHPGGMVRALRASFEHYARAPRLHNTVPGQFSEWFDGESLVNRGMRLSPWEAPRYLWAAVEGICGVSMRPAPQPPVVHPLLPMEWKWVGLRNLAYHGGKLSYFAARLGAPGPGAQQAAAEDTVDDISKMRLYASGDIELSGGHTVEVYDRDISNQVGILNDTMRIVALARPGETVVCVGNTTVESSIGALELDQIVDKSKRYDVQLYNSERGGWTQGEYDDIESLKRVALVIEAQGFRILRLREL